MPSALKYALCGSQTLAYRHKGAGSAVVFAHEMGFDHSLWDAVIALLPAGLRTLSFDLRGHGGSSTPPAPYTMGALVRDAETLLDHLNIRDCVFVGTGLGGMVAQGLAVKRLDQIRALVLANTATRLGTNDRWARVIEDVQSTGLAPRMRADLAQNFSPAFRKSNDIAQWETLLHSQRLDAYLGCATAIAGTDFYTTTASLRLPTLAIASAQDAVTPADMVREMAGLIPGARFEIIRKSGHLPMAEQPAAFASVLSDFLRSIGHL